MGVELLGLSIALRVKSSKEKDSASYRHSKNSEEGETTNRHQHPEHGPAATTIDGHPLYAVSRL